MQRSIERLARALAVESREETVTSWRSMVVAPSIGVHLVHVFLSGCCEVRQYEVYAWGVREGWPIASASTRSKMLRGMSTKDARKPGAGCDGRERRDDLRQNEQQRVYWICPSRSNPRLRSYTEMVENALLGRQNRVHREHEALLGRTLRSPRDGAPQRKSRGANGYAT